MADQNARFLAHVKRIGEQPATYWAIHFHVSELPPAKRLRSTLSDAIVPLAGAKARAKDGEIYLLKNMDLVLIGRDLTRQTLVATGNAVQEVFLGKGNAGFTNVHGGSGEFFTIFDLGSEYSKLLAWAERVAGLSEAGAEAGEAKKPIDLVGMVRVKEGLLRTDITPMLLSQPIYFIGEAGKLSVLARESYISVQILENMFCPGQSLTARRWLFNDLTEDFDSAVLRLLGNADERAARKRITVNMNISTLISSRFAKFDGDLSVAERQNLIFEVGISDVIDNQRSWRKLAPALRGRGYRLTLDGLNAEAVELFDFDLMEADFAKIFWTPEVLALPPDQLARIKQKAGRAQPPNFILARCDTAESVRFARATRIQFVQGRLVDHMVKKNIPM